jgi:CheY-like chemotaxis protein
MEPSAAPSKNYTILLVDDDTFLLDLYSRKFSKAGQTVAVAHNAEEAIARLKEGLVPDIILSDMVMPGMDGIELMSKIKDERLAEKAKLVMFTNQGQSSDLDRANKLGLDGYIVKATTIPSEVVDQTIKIIEGKK